MIHQHPLNLIDVSTRTLKEQEKLDDVANGAFLTRNKLLWWLGTTKLALKNDAWGRKLLWIATIPINGGKNVESCQDKWFCLWIPWIRNQKPCQVGLFALDLFHLFHVFVLFYVMIIQQDTCSQNSLRRNGKIGGRSPCIVFGIILSLYLSHRKQLCILDVLIVFVCKTCYDGPLYAVVYCSHAS